MIEQYIIGGIGSLIIGMCGAIWAKVGRLENKFDIFNDGCRNRHENVVTKDEWLRENAKFERSLSTAHARLDNAGVVHGHEVMSK